MKFMHTIFLTLLQLLLGGCFNFLTEPPNWITSQYLQAGTEIIFDSLTGNDQNPEYVSTFRKSFNGIPRLAYGIKNYRGNDYMGIQQFSLSKIAESSTSFSLQVIIAGTTNIWVLQISYLGIDPTFPHHLNSFDNVGVDYGSQLVNITKKKPTQMTFYRNIIDYSDQAVGRPYTQFEQPLENNKILLFMSALNIWSTNQGTGSTWYPIDLQVNAQVLTSTTYEITISLSYNVMITVIQFSMIFFDTADIQASQKYVIVSQRIHFPNSGGFYPLPSQFVSNFMMGLLDFTTVRGQAVLHYSWHFGSEDGVPGVIVDRSLPNNWQRLGVYALERQGSILFYLKTWFCPNNYSYFNLTTNLCQSECAPYYHSISQNQCQLCPYFCMQCTQSQVCLSCNSQQDHRELVNNRSCQCMDSYYDDDSNKQCQMCSLLIQGCISCFYNTSYVEGDTTGLPYGCWQCSSQFFVNEYVCELYINCPEGFVVNKLTNECEPCSMNCLTCQFPDTHTCLSCLNSDGYFLNTTNSACQLCSIPNCEECETLTTCKTCVQPFVSFQSYCSCPTHQYYDKHYEQCRNCSKYCLTCSGPSAYECLTCDYANQKRIMNETKCVCDPFNYQQAIGSFHCAKIDPDKCDYGHFYSISRRKCQKICTQQIIFHCPSGSQCPSNTQCDIFMDLRCETITSTQCQLNTSLFVSDPSLQMSSNPSQIVLSIQLLPNYSPSPSNFYQTYNWSTMISNWDNSSKLIVEDIKYDNGQLIIKLKYPHQLQGSLLELEIWEKHYHQNHQEFRVQSAEDPSYQLSLRLSSSTIQSDDENSSKDHKLNQQVKRISIISTIIVVCTVILLIFCFFIKNSLPTLISISALQQGFLILVTLPEEHPKFQALYLLKNVLGYNVKMIPSSSKGLSEGIERLDFSEIFINNMNIMLIFEAILIIIYVLLYLKKHKSKNINIWLEFVQKQAFLLSVFNFPNLVFSISIIQQANFINIFFPTLALLNTLYQLFTTLWKAKRYLGFPQNLRLFNYPNFILSFYVIRALNCIILGKSTKNPSIGLVGVLVLETFFIFGILLRKPFICSMNNYFNILAQLIVIVLIGFVFICSSLQLHLYQRMMGVLVYFFIAIFCTIFANLVVSLVRERRKNHVYNDNRKECSFEDLERTNF